MNFKKTLSLICITFISISTFSQEEGKGNENNKIPVIDREEEAWELREDEKDNNSHKGHWAGFDIGLNINLNNQFQYEFNDNSYWENSIGRSISFNFNAFDYKINFIQEYFGLTTGIGLAFNVIDFNDNYEIYHNADTVYASTVYSLNNVEGNYKQNTLNILHLTVPLLLEFQSAKKSSESFYFAAGVVGGVRLSSTFRVSGEFNNGDKFNNQTRSKFNLNPFSVEAMVRTGYKNLGGFVGYNLLPLFKADKTVAIHPIRFGLTLNY